MVSGAGFFSHLTFGAQKSLNGLALAKASKVLTSAPSGLGVVSRPSPEHPAMTRMRRNPTLQHAPRASGFDPFWSFASTREVETAAAIGLSRMGDYVSRRVHGFVAEGEFRKRSGELHAGAAARGRESPESPARQGWESSPR